MTDQEMLAWARSRRWSYRYPLPGGEWTADAQEIPTALHEARKTMLKSVLDDRFGTQKANTTALDLACHQGFYSLALAEQVRSVTGIDINPESIEDAERISTYLGASNIRFIEADFNECDLSMIEPVDTVLMYGLLYHVEDPIRLLRRAASLCRDTLIIETQLATFDITTDIEWGSNLSWRSVRGLFAVVDDQENPEGGPTSIATVPSYNALDYLLRKIGFESVNLANPPDDRAEQLPRGRRVVLAAHRSTVQKQQ